MTWSLSAAGRPVCWLPSPHAVGGHRVAGTCVNFGCTASKALKRIKLTHG
jgi:hypothetical protein